MNTTPTATKKKQERLNEWKGWIKEFLELNEANPAPPYINIPKAAEILNDFYWRLANNYLKPLLKYSVERDEVEHNLHYYKIISSSEITVMAVLPFKFKKGGDEEARKLLNAEFAWFVAISILLNWKIDGKEVISYDQLEKVIFTQEKIDVDAKGKAKNYPLNFQDEHISWLKSLNVAISLPILSNSQTWRMVYLAAVSNS